MAVVRDHPGGNALPAGTKLLDRLVHEARIDPQMRQRALMHAQRSKGHCYDAIIEVGAMSEADLLKYLAGIYRTRFVTTPKLATAHVDPKLLKLVPIKLAERLGVCPILLDGKTGALSVVAADFGAHDVGKQIQMVTRVREVKVYIARPASVRALLRKHYRGDVAAFAELSARSPAVPSSGDAAFGPGDYFQDASPPSTFDDGAGIELLEAAERAPSLRPRSGPPPGPIAIDVPDGLTLNQPPSPSAQANKARRPVPITIDAPDVPADLGKPVKPTGDTVAARDYLETLNVLVALLEQGRGELRGHSAQVARLCRRLGERIGLTEAQLHGILVAAYLHDIGKASSYHLTALNVALYEGHRIQAEKTHLTPLKMLESVALSDATVEVLTHLYERLDGEGFPGRQRGKDVPLGARVLAIVETYCDLTTHSKNPYRKVLKPQEACDALDKQADTVFDGNLLKLFRAVVLGEDLKAKLLSSRPTALLVDADPEETTVLELRLFDHGFDVVIERNATDAYARAQKGGIDVLIAEVDLAPIDGFELLTRLREGGVATDLPALFLTGRADSDSVNRGFEVGATDYLVKPASAELVAAKAKRVLAGRKAAGGRGVSGSLSEMALPDVVQILSNGRKSGRLQISSGGSKGDIVFVEGAIWDAHFGTAVAEEAVYAMLMVEDGDFSLDPTGRSDKRAIHMPTEGLLLEGMRRIDEAQS